MDSEWIVLPESSGAAMEAYRVAAPGSSNAPTILVLHEIFGVNAAMREVAQTLAEQGFEVLIPDLFWRVEPHVSLGYGEADRQQAGKLLQGFDTAHGLADLSHLLGWLKQRSGATHPIGAVGFCIGGKLAALLSARGQIDCGVAFYAVQLDDHVDEVASAQSRLLLHFGGQDAQIPLTLVERIKAATANNPKVEIRVHAGAHHGFFNPSRTERHHPEAASHAAARSLTVLHESLVLGAHP
jgi:carboxymethylenebutenolidase